MEDILKGHAFCVGDDIDTDMIIPSKYMITMDMIELGKHCFADYRPEFCSMVKNGDILVAGKNFGCGSSREHAPIAIKNSGIACIIAESYSRIFFRNAVNMGFWVVELPDALNKISEGDMVEVQPKEGKIINHTTNQIYDINPIPDFMMRIYEKGGLIGYIKDKIKK